MICTVQHALRSDDRLRRGRRNQLAGPPTEPEIATGTGFKYIISYFCTAARVRRTAIPPTRWASIQVVILRAGFVHFCVCLEVL